MSLLDSLHVAMRSYPTLGAVVRRAMTAVTQAGEMKPSAPWDQMVGVGLFEMPECLTLGWNHAVGLALLFADRAPASTATLGAMKATLDELSRSVPDSSVRSLQLLQEGQCDLSDLSEAGLPVFANDGLLAGALATTSASLDSFPTVEGATLLFGDSTGKPIGYIGCKTLEKDDLGNAKSIKTLGYQGLISAEWTGHAQAWADWAHAKHKMPTTSKWKWHQLKLWIDCGFVTEESCSAVHMAFVERRFGAQPPQSAIPPKIQREIAKMVQDGLVRIYGNHTASGQPPPLSAAAMRWLRCTPKQRMNRQPESEFFLPDVFLKALAGKIPD